MVSFKLYFHEIELHRTVFNCSILHEVQCWRTSDCILLTGSSCCICRPAVRAGQCWLVAGIDHSPPSLAPLPAVCPLFLNTEAVEDTKEERLLTALNGPRS